jgi:hypothetical protein
VWSVSFVVAIAVILIGIITFYGVLLLMEFCCATDRFRRKSDFVCGA